MARILVVDDENNIRIMVGLALKNAGHVVETAADGPEALRKYGEGGSYDLVLLDQRMPGMEGLQVLREMRQRKVDARVIMITAFGTIDLAVDAMKAGATDFLRKPFTTDTLRGAVQSALARSPVPPLPAGEEAPITFGLTTINGYRLESRPGEMNHRGGDLVCPFEVISPVDEERTCAVVLPAYLVELVMAHADREQMPGGNRFWQALCEEALANYVWQQADFPPGCELRVEELSAGLRRWIDAVMGATEAKR